jgi:hypothetical protein
MLLQIFHTKESLKRSGIFVLTLNKGTSNLDMIFKQPVHEQLSQKNLKTTKYGKVELAVRNISSKNRLFIYQLCL